MTRSFFHQSFCNFRAFRATLLSNFLLVIFLCGAIDLSAQDAFAPLFPFPISSEVNDNITNIASWNDVPAGKHGFIRVENGQFVHDAGRFLIWGTNTCFSANFPDKEEAEKVAAQLARLGFNCVRLHHMDMHDIWGNNAASQLTLNPTQMDKLDYYIYQLKKHGVYVNINLHVSRKMDDRDGFSDKDARPDFDKGLDNFYPKLIELQKKYAKDLLTHVNPYTKTAYFEEPAVAVVEINNENSVVSQWCGWGRGKLLKMPAPYSTEFQKQWNDFLLKKYKTTDALNKAWKCFDEPLGAEMLRGDSEHGKWNVEIDSDTKCRKIQNGDVMRLEIENKGNVAWHPQLIASQLAFQEGKPYTFSIEVKADKPTSLSLFARMNHAPWDGLGFQQNIPVSSEWKQFEFSFIPKISDDNARFDINNFQPGIFEFRNATLKQGGKFGLNESETIESGTIRLIDTDGSGLPANSISDFCEFLFDIEQKYWLEMYNYLKDDLKVRQPISGTQITYGSTTIQAQLDYLDNHSYWNHPNFPRRSWDMNDWYISNRSLVNYLDRDILPSLGTERVFGKPYTISEFDAPFPNEYAAEGLPILAAFGRFQNWDGIFHFSYSHNRANFDTQKTGSFFDLVGNAVKTAHLPACAAMFRRGDVAEGKNTILGGFDPETEMNLFKKEVGCWNFNFKSMKEKGFDPRLTLVYPTALDVSGKTTTNIPKQIDRASTAGFVEYLNETKEILARLNPETRVNGEFLVNSPNTKLMTGFVNEKSPVKKFGDVSLQVGKTRLNWATISLVSINANGFGPLSDTQKNPQNDKKQEPVRVLVTATGVMQNTEMKLDILPENRVTCGNRFGDAPVLCEGIPMTLTFSKAKTIRCFPLDEKGNRRSQVASTGNRVELKPEYKTIWYEIEVE
ncbi:MAG: carbohydrate binding domain-containing protein [Thermoguttaceae bacterium]